MSKILILQGSARNEGTTANLAEEISAEFIKLKADVKIIHLAEYSFPFKGGVYEDYDANTKSSTIIPEETASLLKEIGDADALVFMTPTYWLSRSQCMQGLMEYLTLLETQSEIRFALYGKPVALVATGNAGGSVDVVANLSVALNHLGMRIPPFCALWYNPRLAPYTEEKWMESIPLMVSRELIQAMKTKNPSFIEMYPE